MVAKSSSSHPPPVGRETSLKFRAAGLILISLAAGCALGPDYERPEIEEPVAFEQTIDDGASLANL